MLKDRIRLVFYKIVRFIIRITFGLFPIQKKVFFSCFSGKCYDDNPKYISEKLHELYPEYRQIWVKYPGNDFKTPGYITIVKWATPKMIYELTTSEVWVDSHLKRLWMPKRRKQYYIETWHGGIPLKKLEKDIQDKLSYIEKETEKYNSDITDLLISNSTFTTKMYRRAFWGYQGEIMECGYPRVDRFFGDVSQFSEKVKRFYNIESGVKILLYAPTFRGQSDENTDISIYKFDYLKTIKTLENSTGDQWCFLLRLHPILKRFSKDVLPNNKIIDATDYDDMQELILAADLLITDYSSCIMDYALLNRVGILYTPDLEEYIKNRGLYFDLYKLPFPLARTEEELLDVLSHIKDFDWQGYQTNLGNFFNNIGMIKTDSASEKVCNRIQEIMGDQCSKSKYSKDKGQNNG